MSSIQERLQLKRVPLDTWNIKEQLCLASAVVRSGDQNWMSVSRALKTIAEPNRPPDWYSQKSCAAQYGALLEHVETPKRKKRCSEGAVETPQESILKRLTQERIVEIQKNLAEMNQQYDQLKGETLEANNPSTNEDRLREIWSTIEARTRTREREAARKVAWLKERDERRSRGDRAWRSTTPLTTAPNTANSPCPPASPLLTSLLKSSPVVTTPQHITHPANVVETMSPSVTAPTLSMLLEKFAASGGQHESKHAAIEHIKSQLVQIEHQLNANNASTVSLPTSPTEPTPTAPALDIDDIEIKAEDVYAFRDIEIHIPVVGARSKQPRIIEKPFKKEETDVSPMVSEDEPIVMNEQVVKVEPHISTDSVEDEIGTEIVEAHPEQTAEISEVFKESTPETETKIAFPEVKFPTTEIKVIQPEILKIKEENKEADILLPPEKPELSEVPELSEEPEFSENQVLPEMPVLSETPELSEKSELTENPELLEKPIIEKPELSVNSELSEKPALSEEPELSEKPKLSEKSELSEEPVLSEEPELSEKPDLSEQHDLSDKTEEFEIFEQESSDSTVEENNELTPEATEVTSELLPEETEEPEEEDVQKTIQEIVQAVENIPLPPPLEDRPKKVEEDEVSEPPIPVKEFALPPREKVVEQTIEEQLEMMENGHVEEFKSEPKEVPLPEKTEEELKREDDEDSIPLKDMIKEECSSQAVEKIKVEAAKETENTHTETDDDTPMELSREEEKDGKKKRDYSRKKKSESRTCSGSESAAEASAPESPHANDAERQHRLWKKSVMLVYSRISAHKYASLFYRPITDDEAPGYSLVVRRPMDLSTIRKNIDSGVIRTTAQFQRDVLLMLSNALMYNSSEHSVYTMAKEMQKEAENQLGMLLAAQAHAGLVHAAPPPATRKRRRAPSPHTHPHPAH